MASIFTYDPDPPRVASPWLNAVTDTPDELASLNISDKSHGHRNGVGTLRKRAQLNGSLTHLQAEPQEGPVEYKLHLLLRPRRKFKSISTGGYVSGSQHCKLEVDEPGHIVESSTSEASQGPDGIVTWISSTQQTRQHRLEQLTTQLLWRLQQSSPHHSSSATNVILPTLPDALPELRAPQIPAKLLHGLEESLGALYEIGVSDDGTLVGLAEDEMLESVNNLRAMAACLGCTVEILREKVVGECEWLEDTFIRGQRQKVTRTGKLLVVEAHIRPVLQSKGPEVTPMVSFSDGAALRGPRQDYETPIPATEQLRITLTGPTMCGKSSLLGTLTTSTLDNGRGKSRISMLKHRHEISSGVTSSVTQELIGYADRHDTNVDVINYATDNIASWIDIHVAASGSRLVFVSDSAGHPRYSRTTVRGLVGWAPHWTLLCIPADDMETRVDNAGGTYRLQQSLNATVPEIDLSGAQLALCLKLHLPLAVVITKLDIASKAGLKSSLTKILDAIKEAGRKPAILSNAPGEVSEPGLQSFSSSSIDAAYSVALPLLNNMVETVPIVLTSAVQGTGISNLHALLHELPLPELPSTSTSTSSVVFHIEDIYSKPAEVEGIIVSGRLRTGELSVGDGVVIGPFSVPGFEDSEDSDERSGRRPSTHLPTSRSFPGALPSAKFARPYLHLPNLEWRRFRVASLRNLRLPVHSILADQVGTALVVPDDGQERTSSNSSFADIRKGMVLTSWQPLATRTFVAEFKREDLESLAVGNHVVVYIASVRAPARIVSARAPDSPVTARGEHEERSNDFFELDDAVERSSNDELIHDAHDTVAGVITAPYLLVAFSFDAGKEFVMIDDQVLVMTGGGQGLYGRLERGEKGLAGLEGFVGQVKETYG